ncbi:hypothetical protein [Pseudomonas sp. 273]|uniref:hypothetical protein n=1 Tax=Pseudomonas sp. 273 TaxID=75692 RepID=UPI0023D835A1|nr:hypothetical protein [Pseudomonas sp. 273]
MNDNDLAHEGRPNVFAARQMRYGCRIDAIAVDQRVVDETVPHKQLGEMLANSVVCLVAGGFRSHLFEHRG